MGNGKSRDEPDSPKRKVDNLALIGFMGSGKSTVGPILAAALGMEFVELDEVIAAIAGVGIEEIFSREGEDGFRRRESEALRDELDSSGKVISCGGGVVLRDDNVRILRIKSRVFLLDISRKTAVRRLQGGSGRPLLDENDLENTAGRLVDERAGKYVSAAHEIIMADEAGPREIAEEIAARWRKFEYGREDGTTPYI